MLSRIGKSLPKFTSLKTLTESGATGSIYTRAYALIVQRLKIIDGVRERASLRSQATKGVKVEGESTVLPTSYPNAERGVR